MSEVEQNKELIRRYTEAIWSGQAAEGEFYAPDAVQHVLQSPSGVPSLTQTAGYFRAALPDVRLGGNMVFGQDDRVMQYFDVTGTHTGIPLFDFPPSGRQITMAGENIFRIANGKIVERWSIIDAADVFQQLSATATTTGEGEQG